MNTPVSWRTILPNNGPEFFLDPETIKIVIELVTPLAEELLKAILENTSKLDALLQKVDQLYLRDIKSGFEALSDGLASANVETRRLRLEYAERALLNNTKLQPGVTGSYTNAHLMAQCHYGLSIIALQRNDPDLAARHVFRTFLVDPYAARKEFFSSVFSRLFDRHCSDVYEWDKAELSKIGKDSFENKVFWEKTLHGGAIAASVGGGILGAIWGGAARPAILTSAKKAVESSAKAFDNVSPEKFRAEARAEQFAALQARLNERCQSLARSALNDTTHSPAARYAD